MLAQEYSYMYGTCTDIVFLDLEQDLPVSCCVEPLDAFHGLTEALPRVVVLNHDLTEALL